VREARGALGGGLDAQRDGILLVDERRVAAHAAATRVSTTSGSVPTSHVVMPVRSAMAAAPDRMPTRSVAPPTRLATGDGAS
jgi:hypothetical protein